MYAVNLPKVSFNQLNSVKNVDVVVIPYYVKKDVFLSIGKGLSSVKKFLPKEAGKTLCVPEDGVLNVYLCVDEKEKQIENKIATAISSLPEGVKKVNVYLGEIEAVFWANVTLNVKKLVAEIMIVNRNKWSVKKSNENKKLKNLDVSIYSNLQVTDEELQEGVSLGKVQAWIQKLVAMPANYLTPKQFTQEVKDFIVENLNEQQNQKIKYSAHDENWVKEKKMGSFYGVAKGSREPLKFLELEYNGGKQGAAPYVFVGKGVTFDTGGISLKPSKGMGEMKGDMAGAANACAALLFAALNDLPLNVVALTPLCENMPDGFAVKPGDVITAMNGKTIEVVNTDAEGRLILADALVYSQHFKGKYTIDLATLTGACITAIGYEYTGLFSDEDKLVNKLLTAGKQAKDWAWQLPMDSELHKSMLRSAVADMSNSSEGAGGAGATNGAIFLKEFAPESGWVHLDIAGVSEVRGSAAPTGRPMPLLAQFLSNEAKKK